MRLVHRNRRRQRGTGLLLLADRGIQRAEAAVTVRLERAHTQCLGEGEGLAVAGFSLFDLRGIVLCRKVAEEAQGIRLVPTFLIRTGERQRTLGAGVCLL